MTEYKIWVDDIRERPSKDYLDCASVDVFKYLVENIPNFLDKVVEINLDHDAGEYQEFGGDYINILSYLEQKQNEEGVDLCNIVFKFHTANPVGRMNMKRICRKNNWKIGY